MRKTKRDTAALGGLLGLFCSAVCAQPPTAPKPALPPLSLAEMEKSFGAPKLISVNFQDTPVKEALNEVGRQAGIRIEGANPKPSATLQFKDAPFWTVMDALLVPNS